MNGLGRQLEDSGGAGENVERVLNAIEFQTAILTLNAAVEAAHAPEPGTGSTALTGRDRNLAKPIAERAAESGQEAMAESRQSDAFPPIAGPGGSTPQTAGNCGAPGADSGIQARLWQESLDHLRQSLAAACGAALPIETDGRPQADPVRPQPAPAPVPVPVLPCRRRPLPAHFSPHDSFEHGP